MGTIMKIVAVVAICAVVAGIMSGTGYRLGWWDFGFAFQILKWSFYVAGGAGVLALIGLFVTDNKMLGGVVVIATLVMVGTVYMYIKDGKTLPAIHDITTDTENPPQFVKIVPLRADAMNSLTYEGTTARDPKTGETLSVADLQKAYYPDIVPAMLALDTSACFDTADATAREQGWEIVNSDKDMGLVEATDTTFWYGFKDDVAIRVTAADTGCRVDVRSISRVGISDLGVNAKRVRGYLADLKAAAG